ncbi:MAG: IS200/IS605 family transposase [Bacteroidota bacterium]
MANTYTQHYNHVVFAVKYRACLISPEWKIEMFKYITGIVQNNKHKMLAINGPSDHIHIFIGTTPDQSVSAMVQQIKVCTSKWINDRGFTKNKFSWQSGFGGFTYSRSQIDSVIRYINNQEEHHKKKTFKNEYVSLLNKNGIEYDERYLFDFF